jgi:hypothetical protein
MGLEGGLVGKTLVQPPDQRVIGRIDVEGQTARLGPAKADVFRQELPDKLCLGSR